MIDQPMLEIYQLIHELAESMGLPYVIVGASARDLIFHNVENIHIERATNDIDFGIEVKDWSSFYALKSNLIDHGFIATRDEHRLTYLNGYPIDLIPFGASVILREKQYNGRLMATLKWLCWGLMKPWSK